jgi:hypothetical protein
VAPDYGISIAGVYHPVNGQLADVESAGGVSPADVPPDFRALEGDLCGSLVSHDHGPNLRLIRAPPWSPPCY